MKTEELLQRLEYLFIHRQLTKDETLDTEIGQILSLIFDILAKTSFDDSRAIRSILFQLSDEHEMLFFAALFVLLKKQLNEINVLPIFSVPQKLSGVENYDEFDKSLGKITQANFSISGNLRLSSQIKIPPDFSKNQLLQVLSGIITGIQSFGDSTFQTKGDDLQTTMIMLIVARQIAFITQMTDLFYGSIGMVCEKLNLSQNYQASSDFAEEAYFTSLVDGKNDWGFFILFLSFTGQMNMNTSLIYANAHLAAVRKNKTVSDLLAKRFSFCLIRFYRNMRFHEEVKEVYHQIKEKFDLSDQDNFNITCTYFSSSLNVKDNSVIINVYEYLVSNLEFVCKDGKNAAISLLNIIRNLQVIFEGNLNLPILENYIPILETIVGKEDSEYLQTVTFANSLNLKRIYINTLVKALKSRDSTDFVSQIHSALVMADSMIILSFSKQEVSCFLLAMILKSDFSLVLFNKEVAYSAFVRVYETVKIDDSEKEFYENYLEFIKDNLILNDNEVILWIGESRKKIYSLSFEEHIFSEIKYANDWHLAQMDDWLSKDFADLSFDSTIKKHGQIEQYLEEDQTIDLEKVRKLLSFSKVSSGNSNNLMLIKDMDISNMPHNLILDTDGEFLSRKKAITCLPSNEWFIENQKEKALLNNNFTKSMWIPTEEGDFTLNLLWSKLEEKIEEFNIMVSTSTLPEKPLSSDINIISAHGAKDIASFNSLFLNEEKAIKDIERLIGKGEILILLVCHSGSMEKSVFRKQILSLVNKFLNNGYQAVIAPFWSLHIDIPPVWLPSFLNSIAEGKSVSESVFTANNEVFESNKNPGAWACLHLYGNPRLRKT